MPRPRAARAPRTSAFVALAVSGVLTCAVAASPAAAALPATANPPTPTTPVTAGAVSKDGTASKDAETAARARGGLDPDAADQTRAQAEAATIELERVEAALLAARREYATAQAELTAARAVAERAGVAAAQADRAADAAAGRTATAGDKVDRYAANLYKAGPVPDMAQLAVAEDAKAALDAASVMKVVADRQAHSLVELKGAQQDADSAAAAAVHARAQAAAALKVAAAAEARSQKAVAAAGALTKEAVGVLDRLRAQAAAEGKAVREAKAKAAALERARSLAEKTARAKLLLSAPMFGLGLPPVEATRPGPKPGLPKSAGADPGDAAPGSNHLRPRANRFATLVKDMFTVSSVGGWRPSDPVSQDHPSGRAVDVMMLPHTDPKVVAEGWRIARFAQANAAELGVSYIIWQGRIWSAQRADEGWRDYTKSFPYGSNANPTTLHMDHVHVSFF